ncbi:MAG: hypothetical protein IID36_04280 [Planctomycetes bacterium]|nr:hypothetical protein [Planctomycetota bacterium]
MKSICVLATYSICLVFVLESAYAGPPPRPGLTDSSQSGSAALVEEGQVPLRPGGGTAGEGEWSDDIESYENGENLHGVNGWQAWDNDPAATAFVTQDQAHGGLQSIDVFGPADLIRRYSGQTNGLWRYTAWIYVPSDMTSENGTDFLIQKIYNDDGPYEWSVQMLFNANDGLIHVDCGQPDSHQVPYVTNVWSKIEVVVDVDNDWTHLVYNDAFICEYQWSAGVFGGDGPCLASGCFGSVDLFAFSSTSAYYDDLSLLLVDQEANPWGVCCPGDNSAAINGFLADIGCDATDDVFFPGEIAADHTGFLCPNPICNENGGGGGNAVYGDITSFASLCVPDGNCQANDVDFDDVLCALGGFALAADCPCADIAGAIATPCVPNNVIDFDDILAILNAFGGSYACDPLPGECGPDLGDCFEANGSPACSGICGGEICEVPLCCTKVCNADAFCCDIIWDPNCANQALNICTFADHATCDDADLQDFPSGGGTLIYTGNNQGAGDGPDDCSELDSAEVWIAFTIPANEKMNIELDYCNSQSFFDLAYIVLTTDCPCTADLIFGEGDDLFCLNGNPHRIWNCLEGGELGTTYYYPILSEFLSDGNYEIKITATPSDIETCPNCPITVETCDEANNCTLRQSFSDNNGQTQVACGALPNTTDNDFARCFNMTDEGLTGSFQIESVQFGVAQFDDNTPEQGLMIPININIWDVPSCPPAIADATLIAQETVMISTADVGSYIDVAFPTLPTIAAGGTVVIEIEAPLDGTTAPLHSFRAIANPLGECDDSYLRTPTGSCDLSDWVTNSSIGFATSQTWLIAEGIHTP